MIGKTEKGIVLLAIDPGRDKCGLAVAEGRRILERRVVSTAELAAAVGQWVAAHHVERLVLGNRTGAEDVRRLLSSAFPNVPIVLVAEQDTTLEARRRYFRDHPPRGWRRLLPVSMQVPPRPYDDYAAVVIAERYLESF